jgi:hypothetical protein
LHYVNVSRRGGNSLELNLPGAMQRCEVDESKCVINAGIAVQQHRDGLRGVLG